LVVRRIDVGSLVRESRDDLIHLPDELTVRQSDVKVTPGKTVLSSHEGSLPRGTRTSTVIAPPARAGRASVEHTREVARRNRACRHLRTFCGVCEGVGP